MNIRPGPNRKRTGPYQNDFQGPYVYSNKRINQLTTFAYHFKPNIKSLPCVEILDFEIIAPDRITRKKL